MSARDWAMLLLLGAIRGGSFFFARVAVPRLESFEFAGMALIALGLLTIDGRLLKRR